MRAGVGGVCRPHMGSRNQPPEGEKMGWIGGDDGHGLGGLRVRREHGCHSVPHFHGRLLALHTQLARAGGLAPTTQSRGIHSTVIVRPESQGRTPQ